ncbi:MAG TPA: MHYT domain-containing protein [Thermoanaerobaculia bacterium]|nr:MHYT domain-containing protein [Thermoanaerobaculia bacterium]
MALFAVHNPALVVLSIVISILGAYAARALAERLRHSSGRIWLAWFAGAAVVDGIGTWSMHYTGMLALILPVELRFDALFVVLSLLSSVFGSAVGLLVLFFVRNQLLGITAAGICTGGGISALHFIGMSAMRLPGLHHHYYSQSRMALSIVTAIVISAAAVAIQLLAAQSGGFRRLRRHTAAVLRGMANPIMHYTAMAAVVFIPGVTAPFVRIVSAKELGILGISIVPLILLVVSLLTSTVERLHAERALFNRLFEETPQPVAMTTADGRVVRTNQEFTRMFGYSPPEAVGRLLVDLIVPPEARDDSRLGDDLIAEGQRVDGESTRRTKDGVPLQVAITRLPVAMPRGPVEIYEMFRDITERVKADEAMRGYPRRLLEELGAERRRIARELHDEIGQLLTTLRLTLRLNGEAGSDLARAQAILDELIERVRNLALDLGPALLDDFGLPTALASLFERYKGMDIEFEQWGLNDRRFASEVETAAYRIVQEAVTNVARHAGVNRANVRIWATKDRLEIEVEDRGKGFDLSRTDSARSAFGLAGMRERAHILGGSLTIESMPGDGTRVTAELPI